MIQPPTAIRKRVVLHFPGFEGLDAAKHRERFARSMVKTAKLWDFSATTSALNGDAVQPFFDVDSQGDGWQTDSRVHIFDHSEIVDRLNNRPLVLRLLRGFAAAAQVVAEGGATAYFRHAWRFGLFFIFPFLVVAAALLVSLALITYPFWLGLAPWHTLIGLVLAYVFFLRFFVPWAERSHMLHLFSDWELAVAVARLDESYVTDWLARSMAAAKLALAETADEYVISSHSMGSSMAAHVLGRLLEEEPDLLAGKKVVFATLGGATLQCAFLKSAGLLRQRVGAIARVREVFWLDVQCLTDIINFYKARVVALCGHEDAPAAHIALIRIKHMLTSERYAKIRRDFLRVHRQYVLDSDCRSPFDFGLMVAGPLPACTFAGYTGEGPLPKA
ncbi:hypothetical protein [Rhizobium sp. FY34]|uniref:hypothetical protein n=1 Tax=Rhizobium sp. FY34 TaxID=2562309 RepID=UPI0010BFA168|nr:hypothetical protein [Rhizobium sp. FY34]